jgi:2-polyprenyl-3-methyl-5-hydroxy-6-metoxy-1,4-benzoquinol methylase
MPGAFTGAAAAPGAAVLAGGAAPPCTGCGGQSWAGLVEQGGFRWWRCLVCGFARLIPMPAGARAEIAGDAIGRGYIDFYRAKLAKKRRRGARRLRRLAARMPGRRLLDVGSNIGCLVESARRLGLDATGIEINRTLVDFARESYPACRFVAGAVEEAPLEPASFDGLYCSEVIEHVPDNERFAAALARLLRSGGMLFLTTPGAREYIGRDGRARARDFGAPDHKLYHTRSSLAALLARHGFARLRFAVNFGRGLKLLAVRGPR